MHKQEPTYYYFLGIGGIGMSALARYFNSLGKAVYGYDKTQTPLTNKLESEGVKISFEENRRTISTDLTAENTLVVRTPAVPESHDAYQFFVENNFKILKRSQVLGEISKTNVNISVAGTHGKTTVSTMLGHILYFSKQSFTAFLGGIAKNYETNYLYLGHDISLCEADEFDRSFLQLHPNLAVITSMDADHLDIYHNPESLNKAFEDFADLVSDFLLIRKGLPIQGTKTYGLDSSADFYCDNISAENGSFVFDFNSDEVRIPQLKLKMAGRHNVENATAAIALALQMNVDSEQIKQAIESFEGIKRRFNQWAFNDVFYIDDYAHHPTELDSAIGAARELFPNKKILGIFQPHLYSRTRDFADGFAKSLSALDELILLDIYPARELPIADVNSDWLMAKIDAIPVQRASLENALELLQSSESDVIMTLGAGSIDTLVEPIKNWLNEG